MKIQEGDVIIKRKSLMIVLLFTVLACLAAIWAVSRNRAAARSELLETDDALTDTASEAGNTKTDSESAASRLETVSYTIPYDGVSYAKEAAVYVPAAYDGSEPMNILYLMHGSQGSGEQLADTMKPLFDSWIAEATIQPMLVVFPTYYPDRTFVVPNYSEDYPLNRFFAADELPELMKTVEGSFNTYAESADDAGFAASRMHRAFGGYSMGGVTTWEVLASHADYFAYYMPMAGDCWLNRVSDEPVDQLLVQDLIDRGYSSDDFMIVAMVGGNDSTKGSMKPQIEALRDNHAELITDENLIYWENEGGGHSLESFELEVEHGIPYLWALS